ncbi:hypothetical protein MNBD_ALPHA03-546 [hydrothermal vent metagenome]|uniref:Phosphate/pyrophosphate-specific outer membrane porin OprP/OprO n=1 Tax=hydrothermal vent metagenome TaxID=652676 RepID=A0A3B1AJW6_9ZZZZ
MRKSIGGFLAVTALCSVAFSPNVSAQTLQELKAQIDQLSKKVEELEKKEAAKKAPDLKVKWKGAPELSSADGKFKMKIRGRIFTDYANISVKNSAGTSLDSEKVDATEFRAARFGVEGIVFQNVKYKFEVDLIGGASEIKDAYLQWNLNPISITVGQFKTPNSLEEAVSARYITFMERGSFTDTFSLTRQIGIAVGYAANDVTFKAGIFQGNFENVNSQQDRTYAARVTYGPKLNDGNIRLHVGASIRHRELSNAEGVRYRQRPQNHLAANRYISADLRGTSIGDADSDTFFGLEVASIIGPFSFQSEYVVLSVGRIGMDQNASLSGGYIGASYFITGESRSYKKGKMDRTAVKAPVSEGGVGAWQLALRYDTIELNDADEAVMGGKQNTMIFGVNWHLNSYARVMANYSLSDIANDPEGVTDVNAFGLRFQVDW